MTNVSRRQSKLVSLPEAAALVADGTRITIGGFSLNNRPMALVRELIRSRRSGFTVIEPVCGHEVELLVGAGAVSRIEASYVGLERFGLARRTRGAIERGVVEMVDYGEVMMFDRFRATEDNWSFLPVNYLAGNSILEANPSIRAFTCPLTGVQLHAVPPADPDVTIIHVRVADAFGNAIIDDHTFAQGLDLLLSRSAKTLILTAEQVVPTEELTRIPRRVQIPSFLVTAVVHAPWGAHPGPMLGMYGTDENHFERLVNAGESETSFSDYLDDFIFSLQDHSSYLAKIGESSLAALVDAS